MEAFGYTYGNLLGLRRLSGRGGLRGDFHRSDLLNGGGDRGNGLSRGRHYDKSVKVGLKKKKSDDKEE